jgi:hypothetical protein
MQECRKRSAEELNTNADEEAEIYVALEYR